MGPIDDREEQPMMPRYPGEDTRRTSTKELLGFYMYGFAAEVFVICGIGSFIPITLEQLARENGVLQSDRTTPCTAVLPLPSSVPRVDAKHSASRPNPETSQCVINFLGSEINTASFAMYTFSISVLLQALLVITMSGAADHGRYRKTLLLVFGFAGAIATMLFLAATSRVYLLGALWAIIGNVCFGASFVLLNSFLPLLQRFRTGNRRCHHRRDWGDQAGVLVSGGSYWPTNTADVSGECGKGQERGGEVGPRVCAYCTG
ncbi:Autophagy protein 22 [Zalaria obscura]|uniref:Autophagy protein 22 n=1 Tax=Zalaria obscura TaxID=2024903 RepID=A0ACC3SPS5_9PEZI